MATSNFANIINHPMFTPALVEQIQAVINDQATTERYVNKIVRGVYRHGMLIGAPGLGKSYAVQSAFNKSGLVEMVDYRIVKGHCTPLALFNLLYLFRKPGQYLVLDDCDVESDKVGIDLLKAATDADNSRVTWESSTIPMIKGEPVKDFVFKGTVVLCTNDYTVRGNGGVVDTKKAALTSRVRPRYVDFSTREKKFAQCYNMIVNAGYLDHDPKTKLTDNQKADLLQFMIDNINEFRSIDLRVPQDLAVDIVDDPDSWREYAEMRLFRK